MMDADRSYYKKMEMLREKALNRIAKSETRLNNTENNETQKILHDLHVHQIELEMQNDELRQAHRDLERSHDRYLNLYHNAPVGYVVADTNGIVLQANRTFGSMMDKDISAMLRKPLANLMHIDDRAVIYARYKAFYKNPADKRLEVRFVREDKTLLHAKLEGHRIQSSKELPTEQSLSDQLLISISDITERKAAEAAIIRAKKHWEQTFDAVPDLMAIIDENSNVIRVNKALSRRLGVEPKDCIGKKCFNVLHDSQESPADCPHQRFYRSGRPSESEGFNRKLNGYFITTVLPFDAGDSNNRWCIHVSRDITDRKRAEDELLKLRNLESIGKLAGGMAHDFNNILTAIIGHIDLSLLAGQDGAKRLSHLNEALDASYRARDLANRLITFSDGGNQVRKIIAVDQFIEATTILTLSGTNVNYELNLPYDLSPIMADEDQIQSAVQNILTNAKEAMPWGGKVFVSAQNEIIDELNGNARKSGQYVKIVIQDTGGGIAANHLEKIFDPYFTTKQMGDQKGMGLGLAISYSIINKHEGFIDVSSTAGQGTTITIHLPAFSTPSLNDQTHRLPVVDQPTRGRKILCMDDEKMIWNVMEQMLHRIGCDVDFALNGEEAIALYKQSYESGVPYKLLILDLTIRGGPGGKEVLNEIHQFDPMAKAIVISGYSSDPVMSDYQTYGFAGALEKPFKAEVFFRLMSGILGLPSPK